MNSSNITNIKSEKIIRDFELTITCLGLTTNLLCIIVFSMINRTIRTNGQMYKYFLMKSICDFIIFIIYALYQTYLRSPFTIHYSIWFQIYYKYLFHFLCTLLKIYSIYFEILATADCFFSIQDKYKFLLTKKTFFCSSLCNFIFFFVFYIGKFFVYEIIPFKDDYYETIKTDLYYNGFYKILSIIYMIFRDIIGAFLMVLFNVLIFLNLKRNSNRKKNLKNNGALLKAMKAEKNKAKMIYLTCVNHFVFHIPSIIYNLQGKYVKSQFWTIYDQIKNNIIIFSYTTPFLIYILYNIVFRHYFLVLIRIKQKNDHKH
jgi:hypothetical protein